MASILLVLTSSPTSPAGQRALSVAESLVDQGHVLTLCCLQDAVVFGSDRSPREMRASLDRLLDRGSRCVVLAEDLACRGLKRSDRASAVDHTEIVTLLGAEHHRVVGAL